MKYRNIFSIVSFLLILGVECAPPISPFDLVNYPHGSDLGATDSSATASKEENFAYEDTTSVELTSNDESLMEENEYNSNVVSSSLDELLTQESPLKKQRIMSFDSFASASDIYPMHCRALVSQNDFLLEKLSRDRNRLELLPLELVSNIMARSFPESCRLLGTELGDRLELPRMFFAKMCHHVAESRRDRTVFWTIRNNDKNFTAITGLLLDDNSPIEEQSIIRDSLLEIAVDTNQYAFVKSLQMKDIDTSKLIQILTRKSILGNPNKLYEIGLGQWLACLNNAHLLRLLMALIENKANMVYTVLIFINRISPSVVVENYEYPKGVFRNRNPLSLALVSGNTEMFNQLIQNYRVKVNDTNSLALVNAYKDCEFLSHYRCLDDVRLLVRRGAHPFNFDDHDESLIRIATTYLPAGKSNTIADLVDIAIDLGYDIRQQMPLASDLFAKAKFTQVRILRQYGLRLDNFRRAFHRLRNTPAGFHIYHRIFGKDNKLGESTLESPYDETEVEVSVSES